MPRGDKSAYTDKQKRQVEHIEESYEHRRVPENEAERRAWATVNKETGGGRGKNGQHRGVAQRGQTGWQGRRLPSRFPTVRGSEAGSGHSQAQCLGGLIQAAYPCPNAASPQMPLGS